MTEECNQTLNRYGDYNCYKFVTLLKQRPLAVDVIPQEEIR
jgi:hypothetical protein